MTAAPLVFLDANVLFSAALGGPAFALLVELARQRTIRLTTSHACVVEAETNIERKRPDRRDALSAVVDVVSVHADVESEEHAAWAESLVHADDVHVLAAAREAGADVLVTGDTGHFGELMRRDDVGFAVRTPRMCLIEGPGGHSS